MSWQRGGLLESAGLDATEVLRPLASGNVARHSGELGRRPHRRRRQSAHCQIHFTSTYTALLLGCQRGRGCRRKPTHGAKVPSQVPHVGHGAETLSLSWMQDSGACISRCERILERRGLKRTTAAEKVARQTSSSATTAVTSSFSSAVRMRTVTRI